MFDMSLDASQLTKSVINGVRVMSAITGIVALVVGILILVWPSATLQVIAFLFGLYFLIAGFFRVIVGVFTKGLSAGNRALSIVLGVIFLVVGVFVFKNPADSIALLGILVGLAWIIEGILTLVESERGPSRWVGITFGIISLIAGLVVLFTPLYSVAVLVIIGGGFLIVLGVIQIIRAIVFGHGVKTG
jgi:uncharacterized membrane protein HdeD (DUF308 family)